MPEVIHVFSEQDSKGSLLAEVHRLQSSLAAMRQARDFHGANSAYLMQERDRLQDNQAKQEPAKSLREQIEENVHALCQLPMGSDEQNKCADFVLGLIAMLKQESK